MPQCIGSIVKITSLQNALIKDLVKLKTKKYRDVSGTFLVEGSHLLQELKNSKLKFQTLGLDESFDIEITPEIANRLSETKSGSTVFAEVKIPAVTIPLGSRYLLCDGVQDPGNLGTMIRTAYSFGFDAVIISDDSVDLYNDKVVRSTQGALFHIPCIKMNLEIAIETLLDMDVALFATALSDTSLPLSSVHGDRLGFIMGSEGAGVSEEILSLVEDHIIIETSRFESLNVAIATAIICYQFKQ